MKKCSFLMGLFAAITFVVLSQQQSVYALTPPAHLTPVPLRELQTKPNERYLYTGEWGEVMSTRRNIGVMLSAPRPLGYLFQKTSADTQPLYRLRQKATGNWLVTTSEAERNSLVNDQKTFVSEKTLGYIYKTAQYGAEQLNRYNNGKGWRLAYQSQHVAMQKAGYRLDGVVGYALRTYYQVGAYYFGMFNEEGSKDLQAGVKKVYGRENDWWGGVRDFHGFSNSEGQLMQDTRGWAGNFGHLQPAIGYYDNSQPAVLEQHIDQAISHGLSYFNFYYYWDNIGKQPAISGGLQAFLAAQNNGDMQFTISPCFHQYGSDDRLGLKPADFQTAAYYIADVVARPNFLKTQSGRPLLFMCDTRGINNGTIASANQFVAVLRQTIKSKTGKEPFILQHSEYGSDYVKKLQGDGLGCLNHGKSIVSGSYQMYLNELKSYFATFDAQRPMVRCAVSGFDERPRTDIAMPASKVRYYRDYSFAKFSSALRLTRQSMQTAPATEVDNYLTLYAWNEWHEGGILEPNARDGDMYVNEVQRAFELKAY